MSIISHVTLGTNNPDRAGRFYDEVLGALGFERLPKPPGKPPAYEKGGLPTIYLYTPEDGRPATWGNGTHIAFIADTKDAVHRFHVAALRLGGACEGKPGPRPHYGNNYYAAYVRDPDGNKLQAVCYAVDAEGTP
ncbi:MULTISPECIES: VOC family protein [Agrobacterium]|uniref:VOC family protein n=1 Tax=Agrobacterium TaxID=357 RepID=UPI001296D9D4|nr:MULTISPECIES: VOC family protein [Agrobacterium]QZO07113.1 VOC family protein [Agrobacterium vitis]UJL91208.1 VOC family protein [Agrobacterium vitis]